MDTNAERANRPSYRNLGWCSLFNGMWDEGVAAQEVGSKAGQGDECWLRLRRERAAQAFECVIVPLASL